VVGTGAVPVRSRQQDRSEERHSDWRGAVSGKYRTLATIVGVAVTSPAVVTVQVGANWLTLLGEMSVSAAWSRVLATFCPATGHDCELAEEGEAPTR
jgi:hypothetical protein